MRIPVARGRVVHQRAHQQQRSLEWVEKQCEELAAFESQLHEQLTRVQEVEVDSLMQAQGTAPLPERRLSEAVRRQSLATTDPRARAAVAGPPG